MIRLIANNVVFILATAAFALPEVKQATVATAAAQETEAPPEFVSQETSELETLRREVREQRDTIKHLQEQIARLTVPPPPTPPTPQELYPLPTDPPRPAKPAAQPKQAGHWETRNFGFRGRRSEQVWVSDQTAQQTYCYTNSNGGGCSGGSCGVGFFGRRR